MRGSIRSVRAVDQGVKAPEFDVVELAVEVAIGLDPLEVEERRELVFRHAPRAPRGRLKRCAAPDAFDAGVVQPGRARLDVQLAHRDMFKRRPELSQRERLIPIGVVRLERLGRERRDRFGAADAGDRADRRGHHGICAPRRKDRPLGKGKLRRDPCGVRRRRRRFGRGDSGRRLPDPCLVLAGAGAERGAKKGEGKRAHHNSGHRLSAQRTLQRPIARNRGDGKPDLTRGQRIPEVNGGKEIGIALRPAARDKAPLSLSPTTLMLHINDVTFRIDGRPLFEQATAAISDGWKVGFVGRNGAGKSTLLKMIRGEAAPESGEIALRKGRRIGGVAQEAPATDDSLIETVLSFDRERAALLAEAEDAVDPQRIAEIHTRLADIDAHSAEARAGEILSGLGFDADAQKRPTRAFSGGWRMRVALAGVLFSAPDLLLLDEPTNYLDIEGTIWLEGYLQRFPFTAMIVSHDRDFLNRAATHILALEDMKLTVSPGDYDTYERRRAEARALALSFRARQEAQRRHMQAFIDRFRAKASKAKQAQSRIKALEKMQLVAAPPPESATTFQFRDPKPPMAPPLIRLVEADLGYEPGKPVLRNVSLRIDQDDRIAILGPNGEGKSTLVKSLSSRLALLKGDIFRHKKIDIAYFAQHQLDELKPKQSALDHVRALMPEATEAETRSAAAAMGFGAAKADTAVEKLSGGEKARLLLGLITFNGPHVIVLDEPTNHLDIDARAALVEALNAYAGAVLLITHDAHLVESVADRLLLVKGGKVAPFDGDIDDYRALVLDASKTAAAKSAKATDDKRAGARRDSAIAREALAPLKKKAEAEERRLDELNAILPRLDAALAEPGLYETNLSRAQKLQRERAALLEAIGKAETTWLATLEAYETARTEVLDA